MNYLLDNNEQGTPEWFLARLGKITSSRADCVKAKGKTAGAEATTRRDYRFQLAIERLTGAPQEDGFVSKHMQAGKENEPIARFEYEVHTGEPVQTAGFAYLPSLPAGASLDGFVGNDGFIEIKCPKPAIHYEYHERRRLPPDYVAQVVHQFWITGKAWCDFVSFNPVMPAKLQLVVVRIERGEVEKEIAAYTTEAMQFLAETSVLEQQLKQKAA